jgi:uncharacterized protein
MHDGRHNSSEEQRAVTPESPVEVPAKAPNLAAAVLPSYVRTVFFGPDGLLKAGWGLTFYVVIFYPLQFVAVRWAESLDFGPSGLWSMTLEEFGVLVASVVPAIVLARIEKRPWGAYGLPARQAFGKLFWLGTVWGFASITILLAAMYGMRVFTVAHLAIHGARIVRLALFWAFFFLLVGLFEDFLFRGYSQFTLTRVGGFWPAAVLLSCVFGLTHLQNAGEQWVGSLSAAVIGLFLCLTLQRTGSLWFAVGFHAAWDWGETFFYSVPDSGTLFPGHLLKTSLHGPTWLTGGMVGPEGSVLCFLLIAALWAAFARIYPEVKYSARG